MHLRKSKKILIYFFLLLLVGSINNIDFNRIKFDKIKYVQVIGLNDKDNAILLEKIKNLNLKNIFFINKEEINKLINENTLIEKFAIFKKYPSSLDIATEKTKFLARISRNGIIFLIGSNGKLSENNFSNKSLAFIFGAPDIKQFLNFKKIIDLSKFSYEDIKNLYFFPSKRWDLELKNGTIIKLPNQYIENSLDFAFEFLNNKNFQDIMIVDARIKNQIILND